MILVFIELNTYNSYIIYDKIPDAFLIYHIDLDYSELT